MPQEEERKYDVGATFKVPSLSAAATNVVAKPVKNLTATYYDTDDLRLLRAGASLRYRVGDELPWTVKLATDVPGVRQEISLAGPRRVVPEVLVWLVAALTRGGALTPVAVLRSRRYRFDLCDKRGVVLAELADDRVSTHTRSFREIEVERKNGPAELLSTVERELLAAGAQPSPWPSKLARALDVLDPSPAPDTEDVLARAIQAGVKRLLDHDPLVRIGDPLPKGDTPVHQMRVACRRLRSDLRTFAPLVRKAWAKPLRDELGWLAGLLGAARDIEVLRARLRRTAAADPLAPVWEEAIERMDAGLAERHQAALRELEAAMRSARYLRLLDRLVAASAGDVPRTKRRGKPEPGPELEQPAPDAPDEHWHLLRIKVKRARYAAEAVNGRKDPLSKSLAAIQELLGEHQDAAIAAQTWLGFGADPELAVTVGRLYERERAAIREVRVALPALWRQMRALRNPAD